MNNTRQDAWNPDEDIILAETVIRYIREGKTQLEAFKEVGKRLSRTPAACGFRWNASIRKQYQRAIELAKKNRKQQVESYEEPISIEDVQNKEVTLEQAISLLEKMKVSYQSNHQEMATTDEKIQQLTAEIQELKQQLKKYEQAWQEMGKLWNWVKSSDEDKPLYG